MKKQPSLLFILLSLGITWLMWIPVLILATIDYLVRQQSFQFLFIQPSGDHPLRRPTHANLSPAL